MNFDEREGWVDINMTDICTGDTAFASDGSDNRTRLDAVLLPHLDAVACTGPNRVPRRSALFTRLEWTVVVAPALKVCA